MENKFFLKLGIGIVVLFGLFIGGYYCYGPLEFKWQKSKLYSENPEDRKEALKYFMSKGEKGLDVIKEYCVAHSDSNKYKTDGNISLKVFKSPEFRLSFTKSNLEILNEDYSRCESVFKNYLITRNLVGLFIDNICEIPNEKSSCFDFIGWDVEEIIKPNKNLKHPLLVSSGNSNFVRIGSTKFKAFKLKVVGIYGQGIYRITANLYKLPMQRKDNTPIAVSNTVCVFVVDE
jgi:hypothetical protein